MTEQLTLTYLLTAVYVESKKKMIQMNLHIKQKLT